MNRPMLLAQNGWYPADNVSCYRQILKYIDQSIYIEGFSPVAAIVPHSGWQFCGRLMINTIRLLREKNGRIDRIFVFGGHLLHINIPLLEIYEAAETPFGLLPCDREVQAFILNNFNVQPAELHRDSTIEILLPIIKYFFGDVPIIPFYLPPTTHHAPFVEELYKQFGKRSLFIGSTDLTHYGANYNFYYKKPDMTPQEWTHNVLEKPYLKMLQELRAEESVEYAFKTDCACSPGSAFGAMVAARCAGATKGLQIGYCSSYDIQPEDSFVNYASFVF